MSENLVPVDRVVGAALFRFPSQSSSQRIIRGTIMARFDMRAGLRQAALVGSMLLVLLLSGCALGPSRAPGKLSMRRNPTDPFLNVEPASASTAMKPRSPDSSRTSHHAAQQHH